MRVYLPATRPLLSAYLERRSVGPPPLTAYAVTASLREMHLGDTEELEYLAQLWAARASLRLLAADPGAPRQRVVLAADVEGADAAGEEGAVRLAAEVPWTVIAAGLVDAPDAIPAVTAAVDALPAADRGDPDAEFLLDGAEAHELAWWATQELADLT